MTTATDRKTAVVVSDDLPTGLAVNAVGVLSVTLGVRLPDLVGDDVKDADGRVHPGIVSAPLPVLHADAATLAGIVAAAFADEQLFTAPFSSLGQSCHDYDEYIALLGGTATADLTTVAVALVGPKKRVNKLVGSLPLLR